MADKNLTFRIGAKDDASSIMTKLASTAKREMSRVEDALDETGTAGQKMARILTAMAEDIDQELTDLQRTSDRLADALGPELAAKVDPDRIVADFRRAGLTFEEIEADADALAAAIKRTEEVASRAGRATADGFDQASTAVKRTGTEADNSRSVLANMAGNSISELPGIAGALGPVNMALGQLTEYATEGNISLKGLAATAGPMAVLGVGLAVVTAIMNSNAKQAEHAKEIQEGYVDALREEADAIEDAVRAQTAKNFIDSDAIANAQELGVNLGVLADSVTKSTGEIDALSNAVDELRNSNLTGTISLNEFEDAVDTSGLSSQALVEEFRRLAEGGDLTHDRMEALVGALDGLSGGFAGATEVTAREVAINDALGTSLDETAGAERDLTGRVEEASAALRDQTAAIEDGLSSALDLQDAVLASADALDDYTETMGDAEATTREQIQAGNDLLQTYIAEGESAKANAEVQATAAGRAATAGQEGAQAQIDALTRLASTLEPGSPLRLQLEGLITDLERLERPRNIPITISANLPRGVSLGAALNNPRNAGSASGGYAGQGTWAPSDTIPTALTPGEFVLRKSAADALGPQTLGQLNAGNLPAVAVPVDAARGAEWSSTADGLLREQNGLLRDQNRLLAALADGMNIRGITESLRRYDRSLR